MASTTGSQPLSPETVPLGTGPPTKEELLVYYPGKFTWPQLKMFVNSGDLGLLKRDKKLQIRYEAWSQGIKEKYGSIVNYLMNYRLQWGKPDRLAVLHSALDDPRDPLADKVINGNNVELPSNDADTKIVSKELPPIPDHIPSYFTADTSSELISITMNDWPYSVPVDIEHSLIWTRLPILPPELPPSIAKRLLQDGLWGFTGLTEPPPSPSGLSAALPALSEWGITLNSLIRSPKGTDEEEELVRQMGNEVATFVHRRWKESEWETAWFVNPPRLQSVPGMAHVHVFARHKTPEQIARGL